MLFFLSYLLNLQRNRFHRRYTEKYDGSVSEVPTTTSLVRKLYEVVAISLKWACEILIIILFLFWIMNVITERSTIIRFLFESQASISLEIFQDINDLYIRNFNIKRDILKYFIVVRCVFFSVITFVKCLFLFV